MASTSEDPIDIRNRAFSFLERGEELYSHPKAPEDKAKGFETFKQGVHFMIDYARAEKDPMLVNKITGKINDWVNRAKSMAATVGPMRSKSLVITPKQPMDKSVRPRSPMSAGAPTKRRMIEKNECEDELKSRIRSTLLCEKPNVKWEDIAGLEHAKAALQEAVLYPIKFPQLFVGARTPWKGILLYGPPGTGKTYLAKACATEAQATFINISAADVMSKFVGESEKLIRNVFVLARENKPAIIFIDEIDSLLSTRSDEEHEVSRRVKTEFLVQMQGLGKDDSGILVLGATNIPWALDPAVRRRFEKRIYIPLPDFVARQTLLRKLLAKTPNSFTPEEVDKIALKTEGYSGSDMNVLVRDACFEPIRQAQAATHFKVIDRLEDGKPVYQPCEPTEPDAQQMAMYDIAGPQLRLRNVNMEDFDAAFVKTKPSVNQSDLKQQEKFTKDFGIEG